MAVSSTDNLLAADAALAETRAINTTAPLTGGGNLSADRTLAISNMTGDAGAGGAAGAVPAPAAGDAAAGKYLKADGTWTIPPDTDTVPVAMTGDAGAGGTAGYVPAPAAGDAVAKKYLGANGLWAHVIAEALGAHGESWQLTSASEEITLDTGAAFTDSTANILPANSIILGVVAYVTQTITNSTGWKLGDPTTTDRFTANNTNLVAGTTDVGMAHLQGSVATDAAGPVQTSAAKVRITMAGGNPGAGKVRVTTFYAVLTPPLS